MTAPKEGWAALPPEKRSFGRWMIAAALRPAVIGVPAVTVAGAEQRADPLIERAPPCPAGPGSP